MQLHLEAIVPFFLGTPRHQSVSGRGEIVEPVEFSLKGMHLVIVCPEFSNFHQEAFHEILILAKSI